MPTRSYSRVLSGGITATTRSHTLGRTEAAPRYVSLVHGTTPCTTSVTLLPIVIVYMSLPACPFPLPTAASYHCQPVAAGKRKENRISIRRGAHLCVCPRSETKVKVEAQASHHRMSIRQDDRHIPKPIEKVKSPHGSRPLRKKIQETQRSETPNKVVKPRPQSKPETKKPQVNQNDTTRCLYIPKKDPKQAAQNDRRSVRKENCFNQDIIQEDC